MTGKLQELLLREDALDLEKAIKICRSFEQANKHSKEMRETKEQALHKVSDNKKEQYSVVNKNTRNFTDRCARPRTNSKRREKSSEKRGEKPTYTKSCAFCWYTHEIQKEKCPAWGKTCSACMGRNHFKSKCQKVHSLEADEYEDSDDDPWLKAVKGNLRDRVIANMIVNDCEIQFQIDSGAQVNTICQKHVKTNQAKIKNLE